MASFQKRGKTWQYTISRMVNGKSSPIRKGGFNTKKEAAVAAAEVEANLQKGIIPHLRPEPFDDYFEEWLNLYKTNIANNTLERYRNTLQTIRAHFGGIPIQNITKRAYQAFLNDYALTHARASTKKLNTHIRACIKDAIDEGLIHTDFTRKVSISGALPSKKPEDKYLNYFDSKRLMREIRKRLNKGLTYYLLLLGLVSGLRFAELVGLTRKDFDFVSNKIRVNKTWGYTKKMPTGFGPTKNEESIRTIKIDSKTMQAFKDLFEKLPLNTHDLVFFSTTSKYNVISNGNANKVLKNLLNELNIEEITVHGLRHTHASILLYKKVSIYYVSERLGHKDIQTTLETYAHVIKELRAEDEQGTVDTFEQMAG